MADIFDDQEPLISFDKDKYSVLSPGNKEDVDDDNCGICFVLEDVSDGDIQEALWCLTTAQHFDNILLLLTKSYPPGGSP